jgi:transcriptional regulator with XRE-family HTH domain
MPKIYADKYDKKIFAFRRWFSGKCRTQEVTQEDLAEALDMTQSAVSRKTQVKGNHQTKLTYRDLLILFKELNATDEEILSLMKM